MKVGIITDGVYTKDFDLVTCGGCAKTEFYKTAKWVLGNLKGKS